MKKNVFVIGVFIGAFVFLSLTGFAQREAVSGAEVTGTFRSYFKGKFKDLYNEIKIQALGKNKLKIEIDAIYPYEVNGELTANLGILAGEAFISGDKAVYSSSEETDICKITLEFDKPGSLVVLQDGYCGFGHNVSAAGAYRKVSSLKPKFSGSDDTATEEVLYVFITQEIETISYR